MKADIHPDYHDVVFQDVTSDFKFLTRSTSPVYLIVYGFLIIAFAYFYTAIQFDPHKQADQIVITSRFRFTREDGLETTLSAPSP